MSQAGSFGTGGGGGGSGITSVATDNGSVPASGTVISLNAEGQFIAGNTVSFSASTNQISLSFADSRGNITLAGGPAGAITAFGNTVVGQISGINLSSGNWNSIFGNQAGNRISTGTLNFLGGYAVGAQGLNGNYNVVIGASYVPALLSYQAAGYNYTSGESSNIVIANIGVGGESGAIRIGNSDQHSTAFVAGITGVNVAGSAVMVNASGQLGVMVSSERFKENIEDLADCSSFIYDLRPVSFQYKDYPKAGMQPGLIAEEVEKIAPQMVGYDREKNPESVAYHLLPVLLLNEIQKLNKRIEQLEGKNHE